MLTVITDKSQIEDAKKRFEKSLISMKDESVECRIGYKGESVKKKVYWSDKLRIWMCFDKVEDSRFWNPFGTIRPTPTSMLNITCEINFPFKGINRRIGGVFATDTTGKIFICHRGCIGGGRKGIGKSLFISNYMGDKQTVVDGNQNNLLAIIGQVGGSNLPENIAKFVREVERIKTIVK